MKSEIDLGAGCLRNCQRVVELRLAERGGLGDDLEDVLEAATGDLIDHTANHVAIALLGGEVDRRRSALFAAADVAQIDRLAEPALGLADRS